MSEGSSPGKFEQNKSNILYLGEFQIKFGLFIMNTYNGIIKVKQPNSVIIHLAYLLAYLCCTFRFLCSQHVINSCFEYIFLVSCLQGAPSLSPSCTVIIPLLPVAAQCHADTERLLLCSVAAVKLIRTSKTFLLRCLKQSKHRRFSQMLCAFLAHSESSSTPHPHGCTTSPLSVCPFRVHGLLALFTNRFCTLMNRLRAIPKLVPLNRAPSSPPSSFLFIFTSSCLNSALTTFSLIHH